MKALTIKEPWATLIIEGYKKYEFRSWKTKYRGKILIHSGLTVDRKKEKRFEEYNLNYKYGHIIGEAEIVDSILVTQEFTDELRKENSLVYSQSGYVEKFAWKLENIKKYDKPIPCKGQLSLWNYEGEI